MMASFFKKELYFTGLKPALIILSRKFFALSRSGSLELIIFATVTGFFLSCPVYAQVDVDRVTRETDRIGSKELDKLRSIPEKEPLPSVPQITPKEGEEKILIEKVVLSGCESFPPERFSPLIEEYENKEVSLTELNVLARNIEQEYLKLGIISVVFIPPQEIKDKKIIIRVIEARLGELKIQEHKYFGKERLRYYWDIYPGEILRYHKMSKSIQLMNKNPDRQVKASLYAGKKTGTTDILLTPSTRFPAHLTATFDKEGVVSTGKARTNLGIRHNNFLGVDDTFIYGYSFGKDFSGQYIYHSLPVSPNGASLVYGYSLSESIPKKEYSSSGIKSEAKNTTISFHQDLYRKDTYFGELFLGFEAKDKIVKMNSGEGTASDPYNKDRLRIFSLGGKFVYRNFDSTIYLSPEYSQGVSAFGASPNGNPLASRGAKSIYSKFNLGVQYKKILPYNLQGNLRLDLQASSSKLTSQEQFSLGGIDSVRGYPSGDYLADTAAVGGAELLIPLFFVPKDWRIPYSNETLYQQTSLVAFADYGYGKRRGALETEKKAVDFISAGAGIRMKIFDQALLRLEWGFPFGYDTITEAARSSYFHLSLDFQDKLPEEIERIKKVHEEKTIECYVWRIINEELARPGSIIRQELHRDVYLARKYYNEDRLEESRKYYEKVKQLSDALYQQVEEYVRRSFSQRVELENFHKAALAHYKNGELSQAKELWQKIIVESEMKPLDFKF